MRRLMSLALLAALVAPAAPALADPVGEATTVRNQALARAGTASRALAEADAVNTGEILATGPDSRLVVELTDGAELTLSERATMVVDELLLESAATSGSISLFSGAFLLAGGSVRHEDVTINTPVATIGIRGTTVWGGPIDGAFGVLVLEGAVTVTNDGGSVDLTEGQGTMIGGRASAPGDPIVWPEEKVARAFATVAIE